MFWIAVSTLLWFSGLLLLWRIPLCRDRGEPMPSFSIVVPARNEAHTLPVLLSSIRAQNLNPREIIVVDDHSEDETTAAAASHGAEVIKAPPLPEGWLGKPWACWQGAQRANGEILVFIDADAIIEPGGLKKILATYQRSSGLISLWPYHRMKKPYEQLAAVFNLIIMASLRVFTPLGTRLKPLGAFGPCVVCSRKDYVQTGGHRQVRDSVLEDIALGQSFLQLGLPVGCFGGRKAISFRMYPLGLGSLVEGFSKGMAAGAGRSSPLILILMIAFISGGLMTAVFLTTSLIRMDMFLLWIGMYGLYTLQMLWQLLRLGNYALYTAILYPISMLFFTLIMFVSLVRTHVLRRVVWKGRSIHVKKARP
jgi:4,4'-diaponeurosporenoate glycosyltransferase